MQVTTPIAGTEAEAWETPTAALGVKGVSVGQRWKTPNLHVYGDQAAATVGRETPLWHAWFQERFPMPAELK